MRHHDLKTWPEPFQALWDGTKLSEFRKNDRDFQVGDVLHLREWDPVKSSFLGRVIDRVVTYVGVGFGIPEGYCQMSLAETMPEDSRLQSRLQMVCDAAFRVVVALGISPAGAQPNGPELLLLLEDAERLAASNRELLRK